MWAFEILPPVDEDGNVGIVDVSDAAYEEGANTIPRPSQLRFVPRSPAVEETIRKEWERAARDGYMLGNVKVDLDGMIAG